MLYGKPGSRLGTSHRSTCNPNFQSMFPDKTKGRLPKLDDMTRLTKRQGEERTTGGKACAVIHFNKAEAWQLPFSEALYIKSAWFGVWCLSSTTLDALNIQGKRYPNWDSPEQPKPTALQTVTDLRYKLDLRMTESGIKSQMIIGKVLHNRIDILVPYAQQLLPQRQP